MAATTLMPLIAQSFVDQASQTTFDMILPASPSPPHKSKVGGPSTATPSRPMRSPKRVATSPRTRRRGANEGSPREKDGKSATDIFSWSDQTLAERYQTSLTCHISQHKIGYGNWGSVWKVKPKLEGSAAAVQSVKLVHRSRNPTSSARVRALWTEFKCIRALRSSPHPNIVNFHTFVVSPSYGLIVMDFHPRLMPVALSESRAKAYFRQLLSAVDHLHMLGISHNDIKPSNILLSAKDEPVLIDFGFAQCYSVTAADRFLTSLSWGTPEYLSPERAKGIVHDERLSDIFALGVTMYEIVVGRTPFEKTEDENFLNREQLEVYCQFYGKYIISPDFEALIRHMIDPSVQLRAQSCATALRHRFFDVPPSPFTDRTKTPASFSTPTRPTAAPVVATASAAKTQKLMKGAGTPVKTPKADSKAFAIYQDPDAAAQVAPSPARTDSTASPFSPRPLALANRASTARTPEASIKPTPVAAAKPQSVVVRSPPPSRIPVRKNEAFYAASPTPATASGHKRFVSNPLASPPRAGAGLNRPRVVSQPLLSGTGIALPLATNPNKPSPTATAPTRSTSVKTVKRKPAPQLTELDFLPKLPKSTTQEVEALVSNPTSPVNATSSGEDLRSAPALRKLSLKPIRRAPSALSFAGLKASISGRRRSATLDSMYDMVEPARLDEREAVTMPLNLAQPSKSEAPNERARLASFSRHMQGVLEARKVVDPFMIAPTPPSSAPQLVRRSSPEKAQRPLQPTVPEPFSFNGTPSLNSSTSSFEASATSSRAPSPALGKGLRISPPQRKSSLRKSPGSLASSLTSPITSPSSGPDFKPGHRRIPTAIRNVPSVVLHESADDADFSESDCSRANTPAFERAMSPPPPPRVVEPSRQLPTWVPQDVSSDEGSDADVDEPTVKLDSSPTRIKRQRSHASSIRTTKKASVTATYGDPPTSSAVRPSLVRNGTYESTSAVATISSGIGGPAPSTPPSPARSALPFTNLHLRSDSQSTFNTMSSSTSSAFRPHNAAGAGAGAKKTLHRRSRSVLSFFSLGLGGAGAGEGKSVGRPESRASNLSSLGWSMSSAALPALNAEREPGLATRQKKKGGKLRRVVGKMFR
ncbi:hypothetical protein Rhopal_007548-T1 [Rhodotorula paludigena]|uniref:Protein kinase domain-containing protein n=1 Tax=Rhodotorula paludigena TaxID=86838 RepID=A0AAV5GW08_9BASI|nr:hypothetical protein Rhopal_007548-T1 [Rhodotorula paludigena]